MRVGDAEQTLRQIALAAGTDPTVIGLKEAWPVFAEFMETPAEDAPRWHPFRDGMFFAWGTYDWQDGQDSRFQIGFTRQFSLYVGDEYDHMVQLRWTFYFEPTGERRDLGSGDLWGDPESPATRRRWQSDVEASPVFQAALTWGEAVEMRLGQDV